MADCHEIIDERFRGLIQKNAFIVKIADDCMWTEGVVYFRDTQTLLWSDIPNNRIMRWIDGVGVSVFRADSGYANGNTRDKQGRLITCEHGNRRVTRTELDGTVTVLADNYQGKRLNSPNDVVVKSDGTIWFTDPTYGIISDYQGHKSDSELDDKCYVFCFDPATSDLVIVSVDFEKPNGLAFSPDEDILYISDSGISHDPQNGPHHIKAFDVSAENTLSNGRIFAEISPGLSDGFRPDVQGNIWTSAQDGVHCYAADGTLLGKILTPERVSNLTFGGPKRNRLFMAATSSVYAIYTDVTGVEFP